MAEDAGPTASWTVREITSQTGYAGALVVEGSPWELLTLPLRVGRVVGVGAIPGRARGGSHPDSLMGCVPSRRHRSVIRYDFIAAEEDARTRRDGSARVLLEA
jgi:hypothetical protein